MTPPADETVIGVAIAIPSPHANVLSRWREQVGDPAAEDVLPHVTLLPPTAVPTGALDVIEEHLAKAAERGAPFLMHLSGTGTFRPLSPVVFIQIARGVSDCELLERDIRSGPLARELDFPYHPHVTVAHDIDDAGLDEAYEGLSTFVARFGVDSFALFVREPTGSWVWRRTFALGSPAISG